MSKIQSIFGLAPNDLQIVINESVKNKLFNTPFYKEYFGWGAAQQSLNFTSVIGASRIEAAASIVNRSSGAPLRSRAELSKYQGEIPAIKEKFMMRESDYRDFLSIQQSQANDTTKKNQLAKLLFNDIQNAGNSAHKRLDIMVLQAISTGKISLTVDTNPDGIVLKEDMDLLMPSENKTTATILWTNKATAKPFDDITAVVTAASEKGKSFSKILITPVEFNRMKVCTSVIDSLVSFNQLQKGAAIATLDKINEYLTANLLPVLEILDQVVGIEKDGVIGVLRPFAQANLSFLPSGKLGEIKNAVCIEELRPVSTVAYASFDNALISKWSENDPWGEFTGVELNAFPALEAIDNIYILTVD